MTATQDIIFSHNSTNIIEYYMKRKKKKHVCVSFHLSCILHLDCLEKRGLYLI